MVLWLGAGGTALSVLIALTDADIRSSLVHIGGALGGLAVLVSATGVTSAAWIVLLAATPLRMLLFLSADAAQHSVMVVQRRVAACLFGMGGLVLVAFGLLMTFWARQVGAPLDALLVTEGAVGLVGVWAARVSYRLFGTPPATTKRSAVHWTQWMTVGVLAVGVVASGAAFEPLVRHLAAPGHVELPAIPTLPGLLRHAVSIPALLIVMSLVVGVWLLQWRVRLSPLGSAEPGEKVLDLEEGLARAAQVLHAVVEVGILEQTVVLIVGAVVNGARLTYRLVEQGGLEALLRYSVRAVMVVSRGVQRWHTGRLRRNLLWLAVILALAVLVLVLYGW